MRNRIVIPGGEPRGRNGQYDAVISGPKIAKQTPLVAPARSGHENGTTA